MEEKNFEWLEKYTALLIRQALELGELVSNLDIRNKYELLDLQENKVGLVLEERKGFKDDLVRNILKSHRPMKVHVYDAEGTEILHFKRSFFWFFSEIHVFAQKSKLGTIVRRFSLLYRYYDLRNSSGRVMAHIKSPLWKPWTFPIINSTDGRELGVISKKWSGAFKEMQTRADNFAVQFPKWAPWKKAMVLMAAIMIDLDYFER